MSTHEQRRLAIARALRGEPQPPAPEDRLARLEREVAEVRNRLRAIADAPVYPAGPVDAVEEEPVEAPPVPPLEPARGMRESAARALFGY